MIIIDSKYNYYNSYNNSLEYKKYIQKSILFLNDDRVNKSLIENNKIIIGVYICSYKYNKGLY